MKLIYHGTSVEYALDIARDGAILSAYSKMVKEVRESFGKPRRYLDEEDFIKKFGGNVEDIVQETMSGTSDEHELNRLTTVSMTPSIYAAERYTDRFDKGVVLGCEVTPLIIMNIPENWEDTNGFFVPKSFSINSLREILMTNETSKNNNCNVRLRAAFDNYSVEYITLD